MYLFDYFSFREKEWVRQRGVVFAGSHAGENAFKTYPESHLFGFTAINLKNKAVHDAITVVGHI